MGKIIERIKNFFCGKSKCQSEKKPEAVPPQEEAKREEKPEGQK